MSRPYHHNKPRTKYTIDDRKNKIVERQHKEEIEETICNCGWITSFDICPMCEKDSLKVL